MSILASAIVECRFTADMLAGIFGGQVNSLSRFEVAPGTSAGQLDLVVARQIVVATGVPQAIDLTAAADPGGTIVSFARLNFWFFRNRSTNGAELVTLFGGANAVLPALGNKLEATGAKFDYNPGAGTIVDAAHKIVTVAADAGAAVSVELVLAGRSV